MFHSFACKIMILAVAILSWGSATAVAATAATTVGHQLTVTIMPGAQKILADDVVTLPAAVSGEIDFELHQNLVVRSLTSGVTIAKSTRPPSQPHAARHTLVLDQDRTSVHLAYEGVIHHDLTARGSEYARGFQETMGMISEGGVYLAGSSLWYPVFTNQFLTFTLTVTLPSGWEAVSQGTRLARDGGAEKSLTTWQTTSPQDDIYLVAGLFTEYSRSIEGGITAMVYLRDKDSSATKLANDYLEATATYLPMYAKLIGPYPYAKFALVENFWETGYGMPSFTLMGPKVIRFPFILHSSYPHEILHSWWGNSVYPDYGRGNWCEGLTAYLADHLIQEQRGQAAQYRQTTLQKYGDYVSREKDFPLTAFTSRHSSATEAVGYGKALMVMHMLRLSAGDEAFIKALREFYRARQFSLATWDDLAEAFAKTTGKDWRPFFRQWTERAGAPDLRIVEAESLPAGPGFTLSFTLEQRQEGLYTLAVPLAVTLENRKEAQIVTVLMDQARQRFTVETPTRPLRLDLDPQWDLFRRLDPQEVPSAFSQALGADKVLILLPDAAPAELLAAYRELAKTLGASGPDSVETRLDSEVTELPAGSTVFILGWENRHLDAFRQSLPAGEGAVGSTITLNQSTYQPAGLTAAMVTRRAGDSTGIIAWLATDSAAALVGLGRKLPHYHKYSYLLFEGSDPANIAKGRWAVTSSPMTVYPVLAGGGASGGGGDSRGGRDSGQVAMGTLPPRQPLATLPAPFSQERLLATAGKLAGEEFQGRGRDSGGLDLAADYLASAFKEAGLTPAGRSSAIPGGRDTASIQSVGDEAGGGFFQIWEEHDAAGKQRQWKNVVGLIPGGNPQFAGKPVVVGAHYDHLGLGLPGSRAEHAGRIHCGADDNASGVAVLLELAKVLKEGPRLHRPILFVAFTAEEEGRGGSRHFAATPSPFFTPGEAAMAMINLDTVGRLKDNKIYLIGAQSAREWIHIFQGAGYLTGVSIENVTAPLDSSDQVSFIETRIPAVQLFTGAYLDYHCPTDRVELLHGDGLMKVAALTREALVYLADRTEPLTMQDAGSPPASGSSTKERKVSLGTIPDFGFQGRGYRLAGVAPGSPAEKGGLREGDVISAIGDRAIESIKELAAVLKELAAGDKAEIFYRRDGQAMTTTVTVEAR